MVREDHDMESSLVLSMQVSSGSQVSLNIINVFAYLLSQAPLLHTHSCDQPSLKQHFPPQGSVASN
jgi:hypothetical protein